MRPLARALHYINAPSSYVHGRRLLHTQEIILFLSRASLRLPAFVWLVD